MMNTNKPLAVVTGASSGIGLELAKQFAHHGYDLLIAAEGVGIHQVAPELRALGASVIPMQVDLATPAGVETLASRITSLNRPIDAIAINAGVGVNGRFEDIPLADDLNLIDLNVRSTVHLAKRVVPGMASRGQGKILFTASVASTMPGPYYATYAASKAFVLSFAEALRHELKPSGVTVTALMPGATDTNFFARAGMEDTKVGRAEKDDPAEVARQGFEALMAGKDHVVTGAWSNQAQVTISGFLPEPVKASLHAQQTKPDDVQE